MKRFRLPWRPLLASYAVGLALSAVLLYLMDAPIWFAMIACGVLGLVWPLPKSAPPPPRLCRFCESGSHRHGLDGECLWCECTEVARDPEAVS